VSGAARRRITGTTWDVYLNILTANRPTGVREVWRSLQLSSPSLAQYHINKLLEMKLIENTPDGKYRPNAEEQVEVLRSFILLRGRPIPRLVLYGAAISGILGSYLLLWPFRWDFRDLVVLLVTLFSIIAFFYEAYKQYQEIMHVHRK
jgi:hypothetical protein